MNQTIAEPARTLPVVRASGLWVGGRATGFAAVISIAVGACAAFATAAVQSYPTKPIRMLVPYTPGGPTDLVGRAVAQRLQVALGQQVVVDNRAGGGVIAVEIAARAAPDGHTILLGTPGQLVNLPLLARQLPFDTLRDPPTDGTGGAEEEVADRIRCHRQQVMLFSVAKTGLSPSTEEQRPQSAGSGES